MSNDKAKHTPEEWKYAPDFSAVVIVRGHKLRHVADFGMCDLPETEANARLIAAAPELLAALEGLLQDFPPAHNPQYPKFLALQRCPELHKYECGACGASRIARAAIAKARGE